MSKKDVIPLIICWHVELNSRRATYFAGSCSANAHDAPLLCAPAEMTAEQLSAALIAQGLRVICVTRKTYMPRGSAPGSDARKAFWLCELSEPLGATTLPQRRPFVALDLARATYRDDPMHGVVKAMKLVFGQTPAVVYTPPINPGLKRGPKPKLKPAPVLKPKRKLKPKRSAIAAPPEGVKPMMTLRR